MYYVYCIGVFINYCNNKYSYIETLILINLTKF